MFATHTIQTIDRNTTSIGASDAAHVELSLLCTLVIEL